MVEYNKLNVELLDLQLNKLKSAVKNQTEVNLRMNIKIFIRKIFPHVLLLTTRQTTRLKNAFEKNISADMKLKISKIIQSGVFSGSLLSNLGDH